MSQTPEVKGCLSDQSLRFCVHFIASYVDYKANKMCVVYSETPPCYWGIAI